MVREFKSRRPHHNVLGSDDFRFRRFVSRDNTLHEFSEGGVSPVETDTGAVCHSRRVSCCSIVFVSV